MGLETSENESVHLSAFRGQASAMRHLPLVTLNVVTTSGAKIPLRVFVVEKITTPLQTHVQQGVEDLPHLRGLKLAHPISSAESFDVSLLIGADHYWDLVEDHVICGPGPMAVASKLGYRIYSLIRRTIFYENLCLLVKNFLKTRGASYNRVFSHNKI